MNQLYVVVLAIAIVYAGILFLLNLIPHVTIRSLGWLSVKHVTIETRKCRINIYRIKLTLKLFKTNNSIKPLHLELSDVNIHFHEDSGETRKKKPKHNSIDSLPEIKFLIPKTIHNFLIKTKFISQFQVHFFRYSILHDETDKDLQLFIEYSRIEQSLVDAIGKFNLFIANGHIRNRYDIKNQQQFFRTFEFILEFDSIVDCPIDNPKVVQFSLNRFKLKSSFARFLIPMEIVDIETRIKNYKNFKAQNQASTGTEQYNSDNKDISNLNSTKQDTTNSNSLNKKPKLPLNLLSDIIDFIDFIEFNIEDFQLNWGDYEIEMANISTRMDRVESYQFSSTLIKLGIYLTSFKIFEKKSKLLELPSTSFTIESSILSLIDGIINAFDPNQQKPLDFETSLTISSPTIEVYYDQIESLLSTPKAEKHKSNNSFSYASIKSVINKLNMLSLKLYIVDFKLVNFSLNPTASPVVKFRRDSKDNLVSTISILSIVQRIYTRKYRDMVRNSKSNKKKLNSVILIKNFSFNSMGNFIQFPKLNVLSSYDIHKNELNLNFRSKSLKVKSVNDGIFLVVREFRNRRNIRHNKRYDLIAAQNLKNHNQFLESEYTSTVQYLKLFELIPSLFAKVKFSIASIQTEIICKDGLPSHIVYDTSLGKDIDLADFKRGISIKIDDLDFTYKLSQELFEFTTKKLECFTLSEYSNEFITDFDEIQEYKASDSEFSDISSVNSTQSFKCDEDPDGINLDCKKIKRVILLRDLKLSNSDRTDGDTDRLSLVIPEVDGRIDVFFIWCAIYAKTLLTYFAPTVKANVSKKEMDSMIGHKPKVKLDVFVESIAMVVRLSHTVDVMIEFDSFRFKNAVVSRTFDLKYARMFVVHPATKKWTRLVIIKEPIINLTLTHVLKNSVFRISTTAIRLHVPHLYAVFTVIDNFLTFFKAIKQIVHNFENHSLKIGDFVRLLPTEKPAIELPRIIIKTAIFGLTIENDPFETELSCIFELGLIEQRERITKLKLFEKGASEIMAQSESIESKILLTNLKPGNSRHLKHHPLLKLFGENSRGSLFREKLINFKHTKDIPVGCVYDATPEITSDDTEEKIRVAKKVLDASLSNSWIKKYKFFRESKVKQWKDRQISAWGTMELNKLISNKYDILEFPDGPHLVAVIVRNLDWTIERAKIEDIDQFLYIYAKKQPKLTYSILIPLYLNLKCKSLNIFLRDYPLPLISFPEFSKGTDPAVHFYGNCVIHETLVKNQNQMRHIFVPFSPAAPLGELADVFYSVFIPRTLETVKFTIDLKCDVLSDQPSILTWCKSYQPAILAAAAALDNFTKPEVDHSPLGWWDKFALLMHGRMIFNILKELCFNVKGSTSPYKMDGKAAGFAFCWKDDVTLKINYDDLSRELIQLDSNAFVLAIPNYSMQHSRMWGSFYADLDDNIVEIDESKRFSKKVIRLSSTDRVRWTLGMIFERNVDETMTVSDSKERTSSFQPHYDVVITNPAFPDHKDSFKTYRSSYIHMALSVVSTTSNGNCFNAGYFTPLSFHYFFDWWHILHLGISLPIRRGNLFLSIDMLKKKTHVKMGTHLVTFKYLFQFDPLTISHGYMHASAINQDSRMAFTGIKARFEKCTIDLHQRKEMLAYVNEELNINNQVAHLKMNRGEINVESADFRIVNATFHEKSIRGYLLSNMAGFDKSDTSQFTKKTENVDINNYEEWIASAEVAEDDYSWIDAEDFIELEVFEPLSPYPKIEILSFCSSPQFSYFREFVDQKDGLYPYGNEDSHNCTINIQKPETTQAKLLSERIDDIKSLMHSTREKLESTSEESSEHKTIEEQLRQLQDRLDIVESVWESFTGESILEVSTINSNLDITRTPLSIYSSHTTNEEMRIASQFDASASKFRNRFIVHNLRFQWNKHNKVLFTKYLQKVNDRKSSVYFMSKQAIDFVESVINENPELAEHPQLKEEFFNSDFKRGADVIDSFYDDLDDTENDDQEAEHKYLIKFIHPQVQLISEKEENACLILSSRDLQFRILDIRKKGTIQVVNQNSELEGLVEARFGLLFEDAQVFVLRKDEPPDFHLEQLIVSGVTSPWLEIEVCYDSFFLKDQSVIEKNTIAMIYNKPNPMFNVGSATRCNVLTVQLSKIVVNATSDQYSAVYYVIIDLLLNSKEERDDIYNRLDKVISLSDMSDLQGLDVRAGEIQQKIRQYKSILLKLSSSTLNDEEKQQLTLLEFGLEKQWIELSALIEGLRLKSLRYRSDKSKQQIMNILADQVIWHLLDSNREPFVDFALNNTKFAKISSFDGSKLNKIEIALMQGFNLQESAVYPELTQPILGDASNLPIIALTWTLLEPVGGIPVLESAKLEIQPLTVQLDFNTSKKLFRYLFPKDDSSGSQRSETGKRNGKSKEKSRSQISSSTRSSSNLSITLETSPAIDNLSDKASMNPFKLLKRKVKESRMEKYANKESSSSTLLNSESGSGSASFSGVLSNDDVSKSSESSQSPTKIFKSSKSNGKKKKQIEEDNKDDIALIVSRSSKFMSIVDMFITKFNLVVSFQAPPHLKFFDAHKLSLNIPDLRYREKLWSVEDIILHIRKDIIRIILSHTGKIIGDKFKTRKRNKVVQPLKQIADFSSFLTIQDLQDAGRSRDAAKLTNGPHPHPHHHHHHHIHRSRLHETRTNHSTVDFEKVLQEIIDEDEETDSDIDSKTENNTLSTIDTDQDHRSTNDEKQISD